MYDINSIFKYAEAVSLSIEEEVALITAAQADPNGAEFNTLLRAYGPALRSAVGKAKKTVNEEEVQGEALALFAEVVLTHDTEAEGYNGRLAGRLFTRLRDGLASLQAQEATAFTIPKPTYVRYYGILNRAENDPEVAYALAPSMGMTSMTWAEVHAAVQDAADVDGGTDEDGESGTGDHLSMRPLIVLTERDAYASADDALTVEVAMKSLSDEEERIVRLSYGFTGTEDYAQGEVVPDGIIADRIHMSRQKVQRTRSKALGKMREALGVSLDSLPEETESRTVTVFEEKATDEHKMTRTTKTEERVYTSGTVVTVVKVNEVVKSKTVVGLGGGIGEGIAHRAVEVGGTHYAACSLDKSKTRVIEHASTVSIECPSCRKAL